MSVLTDITKRKQAEEALRESGERFRALFVNAPLSYQSLQVDGNVLEVNDTWCETLGYARDEVIGKNFADFLAPGFVEHFIYNFPCFKTDGEIHGVEFEMVRKDGRHINVMFEGKIGHNPDGSFKRTHCILQDVTERKRAEEQIAASLKEKEVPLREIHHRVKNNMQLIVSLLRMHARRSRSERMQNIFDDCRDRVNAMSLIHEALYQSEDLARIDFEAYLKKLCRNLSQAYGVSGKGINVTVGKSDVSLGMDQGIAVGMVICELVSNAFKHAFPEGGAGSVSVSLNSLEGNEIELLVQDDGVGLPAEIDIQNSPSLGLELAGAAVAKELGGSIEVERDGGTRFTIRFQSKNV